MTRTIRPPMPNAVLYVLAFVAIAAAIFAIWYFRRRDPSVCVHGAVPTADGFVFYDRQRRLTRVRDDGTVVAQVDEEHGATVQTWTSEAVWLSTSERPLYARRLNDLAPLEDVERALRSHDVLARGFDLRGHRPDGRLVLAGRDGRRYFIGADGEVGPDEGGPSTPHPPRDPTDHERRRPALGSTAEQRAAGVTLLPTRLDLVGAQIIMRWPRGEPVHFEEPSSFLVVGSDVAGPNGNHVLARADPGRRLLWTLGAADIVGPTDLDPSVAHVLAVRGDGERLTILAQARRLVRTYDASSVVRCEPRIVVVNTASGAVRSRAPLRL